MLLRMLLTSSSSASANLPSAFMAFHGEAAILARCDEGVASYRRRGLFTIIILDYTVLHVLTDIGQKHTHTYKYTYLWYTKN